MFVLNVTLDQCVTYDHGQVCVTHEARQRFDVEVILVLVDGTRLDVAATRALDEPNRCLFTIKEIPENFAQKTIYSNFQTLYLFSIYAYRILYNLGLIKN